MRVGHPACRDGPVMVQGGADDVSAGVTKEELLDGVWRDAFVAPDELTRAVAQLRKALGDDAANAQRARARSPGSGAPRTRKARRRSNEARTGKRQLRPQRNHV